MLKGYGKKQPNQNVPRCANKNIAKKKKSRAKAVFVFAPAFNGNRKKISILFIFSVHVFSI